MNWIACGCRLCHFPVYLCNSKGSSSEATGDVSLPLTEMGGNGTAQERYINLRHPGATLVPRSCTGWSVASDLAHTHTHSRIYTHTHTHTHKTHSFLLKLVFRTLRLYKKVRRMYLDSLKFVHASRWLLYFVF